MIYNLTLLNVCDNSGVKTVKCFKIYNNAYGKLGSLINASVKKAKAKNKLEKGAVVKAIVIRKKRVTDRKTGNFISFDSNDVIILNEKQEPVSTRIFGPMPLELRKKSCLKLLSLTSILI